MKISKIKSIFNPFFDWLQVEVTSHCNASCIYCPNSVYQSSWKNQHLSLDTFKTLLPYFRRTLLVYLQGWGEPFLNPDIFEMIKLTKQTGAQAGTTTNGIVLNEKNINRLINSEIDIITFSLAGLGDQNDAIRKGTNYNQIIKTIELINFEKNKRKLVKPEIHIAYLLLKSGLEKIQNLPETFAGKGINQIIISTLDFVPQSDLEAETIRPNSHEEFLNIQNKLEGVVIKGKEQNLKIFYRIFNPNKRKSLCAENVQKSLYISVNGFVSPCVFTNIPTIQNQSSNNLRFGNINHKFLSSIWRQKDYKTFRNSFYTCNLLEVCKNCPKLNLVP
jgi:radical SAM protein with 4Fe4S-binding SPASM domain